MNTKRKDMLEETAEVENNVSGVQEQGMVKSNLSSNSLKKFKSKSLKVDCGIPGCKAKPKLILHGHFVRRSHNIKDYTHSEVVDRLVMKNPRLTIMK